MFLGHTIECCSQHNHKKAGDAWLCKVKRERDNQHYCNDTLGDQRSALAFCPLLGHFMIVFFEHQANFVAEWSSIAK